MISELRACWRRRYTSLLCKPRSGSLPRVRVAAEPLTRSAALNPKRRVFDLARDRVSPKLTTGAIPTLQASSAIIVTEPVPCPSLRKNFSWTFAGSVIYFGSQWGVTVVLAKLGSAEMVGQFAFALAIVMPVIALTSLQLRVVQATDVRHEFAFGHYLALRLLTVALAVVIIVGILWFSHCSRETALVLLAVTLVRVIEAISDVFFGLLQQRERMDWIAASMMRRGLLQLAVFAGTVFLTQSVAAAAVGMACVAAAMLLLYDLPNGWAVLDRVARRAAESPPGRSGSLHGPHWQRAALQKLAWLGLPIGVVTAMNSLTGNVPRYFIAHYLGERDLGIFAAMFYLTIAGGMVITGMADPASPRLAKLFAAGNHAGYTRLLIRLLGLALATGLAGFIVALTGGKQVLMILYRPEYATQTSTFLWLMAATVPMYIANVLGVSITAMRRFHIQVPLPAMNLLFTTLLAGWLIPRFHLAGVGQVVFFTAIFSMLTSALLLILCMRHSGDAGGG